MKWIEKEILKYRGKNVLYKDEKHVVEEVFWKDEEELFVYYIKDINGNLKKVFEEDIELV